MDYAQVLPQLFVGSNPQTLDDIDGLCQGCAITAILNLQTDDDMRSLSLDWKLLEAHYRASGIEICRVPVSDFDAVDLREKLPACVRALDGLLSAGHSVYLHCTAGAGRSPSVAIAFLHWCQGWNLDRAADYVKQRRDCSPNVEAIRQARWGQVNEPATPPPRPAKHNS